MIRKPKSHQGERTAGSDVEQTRDSNGSAPNAAESRRGVAGGAPGNEPIEVSEAAADVVKQLTVERDEAIEGRLRALADFRNYQRRAAENEQRAVTSGASRIVRAILPALDHFDLAMAQKPEQMTVEQLLEAVGIVRDDFLKALSGQGVERIDPARGEAFDPHRHEAVMRQAAEGLEPNSIVMTLQSGYALGDQVLRPAKVAVAPSDEG